MSDAIDRDEAIRAIEDAEIVQFDDGFPNDPETRRRMIAALRSLPAVPPSPAERLTFDALRRANLARLPEFRDRKGRVCHVQIEGQPVGFDWSLSQWSNAVCGELGEAANLIKKIERGDMTLDEARSDLADEICDVVTYLDILAHRAGIDMGKATIAKWNRVSERVGSSVRLAAPPTNETPSALAVSASAPTALGGAAERLALDPESLAEAMCAAEFGSAAWGSHPDDGSVRRRFRTRANYVIEWFNAFRAAPPAAEPAPQCAACGDAADVLCAVCGVKAKEPAPCGTCAPPKCAVHGLPLPCPARECGGAA